MIKRCLIGFTVLISCFLFASKVSALEAHNINDLDLFSEEITEDYLYETYGVSKDAFPYVVMFASENSVISGRYEVYLFFMTENDNLGLRDYESGGVFFCSFYGDFAYYTWTSTNAITEEIDLANYTINYKSGASKGTWRGSKTKDDFYYFSNFDILTLNNPGTNNLSDVKITTDVYLPANQIQNYGFNKLNEVIDTDEIRSIQLDFIIPSNSLGTSLDFSYNINSSKDLFDSPYFTSSEIYCSTDETGASSCTPFAKSIDWYLDYNFATNQNDILKNLNSNLERYSNYVVNDYSYILFDDSKSVYSISFFISFDTVSGFDVNINFESNLYFNITYNYKNTSDALNDPFIENYYSTIDLTGKYGVAFLPQTNLDDSYTGYRTLFKANNMVDIQLRDNYDSQEYIVLSAYSLNYCNEFLSNQNTIPYSCNNINGVFDFYINQSIDTQTLFFINKNYENDVDLLITYDTRYYSYIIFETEYSTGTVIRPGEEEETEIYIGYFYNYYDKYKNYELEHNFDIFLKPIKFIFDSISDFYNYYCPPVFKSFLMISFTFIVSLILIKLFL